MNKDSEHFLSLVYMSTIWFVCTLISPLFQYWFFLVHYIFRLLIFPEMNCLQTYLSLFSVFWAFLFYVDLCSSRYFPHILPAVSSTTGALLLKPVFEVLSYCIPLAVPGLLFHLKYIIVVGCEREKSSFIFLPVNVWFPKHHLLRQSLEYF